MVSAIHALGSGGSGGEEVVGLASRGLLQVNASSMGFSSGTAPILDTTDLAELSPNIEVLQKVVEPFRSAKAKGLAGEVCERQPTSVIEETHNLRPPL